MLTFAIGDVHGCATQLVRLVKKCQDFAAGDTTKFIFLGDYIDRGPDSRGVVQFLMDMQAEAPANAICLAGNHEDLLIDGLSTGDVTQWLRNGGNATLASYDVGSPSEMPPHHLEWLGALLTSYDDEQRFFVHAGINPALPLDQQTRDDLLWIREPFLSSEIDYVRLIVHGHTPTENARPDIKFNRINIDTGAVFGGTLTAAVFSGQKREPIQFLQCR